MRKDIITGKTELRVLEARQKEKEVEID